MRDEPPSDIDELRQILEELREEIESVRSDLRIRSKRISRLSSTVRDVRDRLEQLSQERAEDADTVKQPSRDQDESSPSEPSATADDRSKLTGEKQAEDDARTDHVDQEQQGSARDQTAPSDGEEEYIESDKIKEEERGTEASEEHEQTGAEREQARSDRYGRYRPGGGEESEEPENERSEAGTTPISQARQESGSAIPYAQDATGKVAGESGSDAKSVIERAEEYLTGYGYLVIGVIALLFSAGFLLKLAYEEQWLSAIMTDRHKIMAGTVLGALLIVAGEYLVRMNRSYFARGIFGLALGWLYFIFYAGFHYFDVFSQTIAGGYMVGVTATGLALSVRHRSRLIAHLSFIGGFLTPWFISTGTASTVPLFLYVTGLITGFLVLSIWMDWPDLDVTAQIGTFSIFFSWFVRYFSEDLVFAGAVFFWIFYGILLGSLFIKYRWWLRQAPHEPEEETGGREISGLSAALCLPYNVLPIAGGILLLLMYQENVPAGLFVPGGGFSLAALGTSFFVTSSFLTRTDRRPVQQFQYLIGLGIFAAGSLLHLHNNAYPEWIASLMTAGLYAGYHLIRIWKSDAYYVNPIPRLVFSKISYSVFFFWFIFTPPGPEVVLPLLFLILLFLLDHLTAAYRFLFRDAPLSFPYHFASGAVLFFAGGILLLSGLVPGTQQETRQMFPWFCYVFGGFFLLEHAVFVRNRDRPLRYIVQSILMLALVIAPMYQAETLRQHWASILPVSGLFLLGYEAMLFQLDIEQDWLIGAVGFLCITCFLFAERSFTLNTWALQIYGAILFLSFLRIPHRTMVRQPDTVTDRDHLGVWFLFTGYFVVLQMLIGDHTAVARYGSWMLVYLALLLGYQLLGYGIQRFFHSYTALGLFLGSFAHLHHLGRDPIDALSAWVLLFPFLVFLLSVGHIREANGEDTNASADETFRLPSTVFLYAIPMFAYSLFFADLLFYHVPDLAPGSAGSYFQQPILHEIMLTFVTVLVTGGPVWKKIRHNRNIQRHSMVLFQVSLLLFYVASFFVANEFQTVQDWIIPLLLAPVVFGAAYLMSARRYDDQKQKMLYLINGFLMTTHGLLIAFEHEYQTLFLGVDAVVFFTLARMYRWKWIPAGSALTAAWLGLHLLWSSYVVQSGLAGEGITAGFVCRCAGLGILLLVPYVANRFPPHEEKFKGMPTGPIVVNSVALLVLYLGNLKLISFFGWHPEQIQQHMNPFMYALSALWGGAGLVYFLAGFLLNYRFLRLFGSLLLLITTAKVFFLDLNVEMIWRVLSFFTLGSVLLLINYVYRSYIEPDPGSS